MKGLFLLLIDLNWLLRVLSLRLEVLIWLVVFLYWLLEVLIGIVDCSWILEVFNGLVEVLDKWKDGFICLLFVEIDMCWRSGGLCEFVCKYMSLLKYIVFWLVEECFFNKGIFLFGYWDVVFLFLVFSDVILVKLERELFVL